MKTFLAIGALGIGGYFVFKHVYRPVPHWSVGEEITAWDPEDGWLTMMVVGIEWRDTTVFEGVDEKEYPPQWWYHLIDMRDGWDAGYYPEQFLEGIAQP